jgi:hypothetical protein
MLLILGMILIVGPAVLPFAVVFAIALAVYRAVARHRHTEQSPSPH